MGQRERVRRQREKEGATSRGWRECPCCPEAVHTACLWTDLAMAEPEGRGIGPEGQDPGQGHGEHHGGGQAQRQAGLDAGGSGRDAETKQAGNCSGTQEGRAGAQVSKSP